jgi:type IV secretory pathway TrbF-like protein
MIEKDGGAAPSGRGWRRIAIVAATVSVLMGGVTVFATQTGATEPHQVQRDRLLRFEQMGCKEIASFPKHGWVCMER